MKLRNKIEDINKVKEWEDAPEEPEGWCVTMYGGISRITKDDEDLIPDLKEIGNYFNDKESAYDALDKLKSWKRLKDKGFRFKNYTRKFDGFRRVEGSVFIVAELDDEGVIGMIDELNICFGGEE